MALRRIRVLFLNKVCAFREVLEHVVVLELDEYLCLLPVCGGEEAVADVVRRFLLGLSDEHLHREEAAQLHGDDRG